MTVRTTLGFLLALAITGSVHSAYAQPSNPPAKDAVSVDPATRERSRVAFRKGVAQLRAKDWPGARASFEEAWSLVQHPSILLNLGIARLRTDEPVLAEQDLVRFLSEDPGAAADEIASARDALAEARSKIGTLRIVITPPSARVVVDGVPVAVRAPAGGGDGAVAEARLKAGKHGVAASADGFTTDERSVDVSAKSEAQVSIALVAKDAAPLAKAPPERAADRSTRTIVGWSLAGVGGVALVATGIMGARAISLSSDYEDPTDASFQNSDVKSEGVAFRTGADVAFIVALLAGAGAAILLLTDVGSPRAAAVARLRSPSVLRW